MEENKFSSEELALLVYVFHNLTGWVTITLFQALYDPAIPKPKESKITSEGFSPPESKQRLGSLIDDQPPSAICVVL